MRWVTGINHSTRTPPKVSLVTMPNRDSAPEIKIDVRGGGIYLSVAEAQQLSADLAVTVADVE